MSSSIYSGGVQCGGRCERRVVVEQAAPPLRKAESNRAQTNKAVHEVAANGKFEATVEDDVLADGVRLSTSGEQTTEGRGRAKGARAVDKVCEVKQLQGRSISAC